MVPADCKRGKIMQFNSIEFFVFFAICLILYYYLPLQKNRWLLLVFSIVFYACFSKSALLGLFSIALVSWLGEMIVGNTYKKWLLGIFVMATLFPLVALKYFDLLPGYVLPVGISFFTLQAVSGIVDVYKKKSRPSDFWEHLLYLSFFPTVVSGPIIRKNDFLTELEKKKVFIYEDVRNGFYRIAIGFVEKFFLADRIAKLVDYVYGHVTEVGGAQIVTATILFGLQLYYDFAGYSHMTIGFAKCFGISIMENFERPYFSYSIKEFWRRWHISLSSWLRDYVYIPLGGNRKGTIRKHVNLILTFMVSGIWHGVGLNYLFWGFLHGLYQVAESCISEMVKEQRKNVRKVTVKKNIVVTLLHWMIVVALVDFAWIFFRAENMATAVQMITKIFTDFQMSGLFTSWWFDYGMSKIEYLMWLAVAFGILIFDILEEREEDFLTKFGQQNIVIRWSVYVCLIFVIITAFVIGVGSNANSFLYQNF